MTPQRRHQRIERPHPDRHSKLTDGPGPRRRLAAGIARFPFSPPGAREPRGARSAPDGALVDARDTGDPPRDRSRGRRQRGQPRARAAHAGGRGIPRRPGVGRRGGASPAFEREGRTASSSTCGCPGSTASPCASAFARSRAAAETPVLFLTALRDVDTFDRALRAGGDDFLTKPVRPTELVIRVQTALKLQRLSAELREHYDLLKRQRDDLLRLQLQKERLMAFVVHDLKNPVNSIDLHAQLLLRDGRAARRASRIGARRSATTARQLNRMILNLLDISKADEGKLAPQRGRCRSARARRRRSSREIAVERASGATWLEPCSRPTASTPTRTCCGACSRISSRTRSGHAPPGIGGHGSSATDAAGGRASRGGRGDGHPAEMRETVFDPFVQLESARTDREPERPRAGAHVLQARGRGARRPYLGRGRRARAPCSASRMPHGRRETAPGASRRRTATASSSTRRPTRWWWSTLARARSARQRPDRAALRLHPRRADRQAARRCLIPERFRAPTRATSRASSPTRRRARWVGPRALRAPQGRHGVPIEVSLSPLAPARG